MDIEKLEIELQDEKNIRERILNANKNLEKQILDLKIEIARVKKQEPANGGIDSDGFRQLQEHIQTNTKLERNIALEKERLRILTERNTDITDMDLDILSQTELIRLVKQLERVRTDLQSTLREIEVNLDIQANDIIRLNEMKNLYQAEIDLRDRKRRQTISNASNTARM